MHISIISVASRVPQWVNAGYQEYAKRLQACCTLALIEIKPANKTSTTTPLRGMQEESKKIRNALPERAWVVALDERGQSWTSLELAKRLAVWQQLGQHIVLIIGGTDGLDPEFKAQAQETWSLSSLTLPHAFVRLLLVEQLYRAWSILQNHPYHRT